MHTMEDDDLNGFQVSPKKSPVVRRWAKHWAVCHQCLETSCSEAAIKAAHIMLCQLSTLGPGTLPLCYKHYKLCYNVFWGMGVSENSVPLNPMVLLIIIPMKNGYFIGNINPTFSDKPVSNQSHAGNIHFCKSQH